MNAMSSRYLAAVIVLAIGGGAVALNAIPLRASTGGDEVAFPDNFARGVLYATVDRADLGQYRELYAPAAAIAAIRADKPLPVGTVLTMVEYAVKLDSTGRPVTDTQGRFLRGDLVGFLVMEKRPDRDAQRSSGSGDGKWHFQIFTADKRPDKDAKSADCVQCHQKRRDHDFIFTDDRMKPVSPEAPAR